MSIRIALAQVNLLVGDIEGNTERVIQFAHDARLKHNADVIVYPELTLTGYPPEDLLLRPELHQRVEAAIQKLCAADLDIAMVVGYPRMQDGQMFNAAGVISGSKVKAEYFKRHLPNYSVFDEKRYFEADDKPCVIEVSGHQLGITLCEDIWFEGPARDASTAGADILLNLNASPFHIDKAEQRERMIAERCRQNDLPIVYVNLVGAQDELTFDGGSFTCNAMGQVVQRSEAFAEHLDIVSFDDDNVPEQSNRAQQANGDAAIYAALVTGVRDYVTKNGFSGAILGLSGGIDSALTLCIAVDALGAENVEVVSMPSRYTADMSNEDAQKQAATLGVEYHVVPIEPAFKAFQEMLAPLFGDAPTDVTEENIQARSRGVILMALSNKQGKMLLTTGNKSEMAVGYATLYGDMAGGFAPLKDVAKTLVFRLSRWRNRDGEVIPERVITRPPSAELRPDQKDTDSLPDYDMLDEILRRYIELDQDRTEIIAAGFDAEVVKRITRLVDNTEYKRRQAPPGVRITERGFGRDRRYPIVNGF
ncbi:MAG: NAD+ synthase [bacterium]